MHGRLRCRAGDLMWIMMDEATSSIQGGLGAMPERSFTRLPAIRGPCGSMHAGNRAYATRAREAHLDVIPKPLHRFRAEVAALGELGRHNISDF